MPYVPPKRPTTAPTSPTSPIKNTSTVTPTFDKSVFEPNNKSKLYSLESKTAPTSPTLSPDLGDIITPETDTSPKQLDLENEVASSTWSKRKPVPGHLVLPNTTVPSSHPFARSASSAKPSPREEGPPTPVSPRHSGPVPPRRNGAHSRNVSQNRIDSPISPTESDLADRPGLFWQPPATDNKSGDDVELLKGDDHDEDKTVGLEPIGAQQDARRDSLVTSSQAGHSSKTISRASSARVPVPTLSADETHTYQKSATPAPVSETPIANNKVVGATHPLRMRFDKSLPALPLDAETASPSRPTRISHVPTASTSSDPSTQVVTPRSVSHQTERIYPIQDVGDSERNRSYWPKRLGVLGRAKKDKEKAKSAHDIPETNGDKLAPLAGSAEEEEEPFSVDRIPSKRSLWEAGTHFLTDEDGKSVCFGDMFPTMPDSVESGQPNPPTLKTAVFFIRHFWCGQCQDFMFASLSQLDPEALEQSGIKVIVISNGSWKIIKSYKKLFNCPFPIYVDGPRKLYQLMGYVEASCHMSESVTED